MSNQSPSNQEVSLGSSPNLIQRLKVKKKYKPLAYLALLFSLFFVFQNFTTISAPRFKKVAFGWNNACGIDEGGALYCWGENKYTVNSQTYYQMAGPGIANQSTPLMVIPSGVTDIFMNQFVATCAIVNGSLFCSGYNANGNLGTGTTSNNVQLAKVLLPEGTISSVSMGKFHSCAVVNDEAYCWGSNSNYQLGFDTGTTYKSTTPQKVNFTGAGRILQISAGLRHTCAVDDLGQLWCWGTGRNNLMQDPNFSPAIISTASEYDYDNIAYNLFRLIYGHAASAEGFKAWSGILSGKANADLKPYPIRGAIGVFINDTYFDTLYGGMDNSAFITLLYNRVLLRAPDSGGHSYWVSQLNSGITKKSVFNSFIDSQEAQTAHPWINSFYSRTGTKIYPKPYLVNTGFKTRKVAAGYYDFTCAIDWDSGLWCWGANDHYQTSSPTFNNPGITGTGYFDGVPVVTNPRKLANGATDISVSDDWGCAIINYYVACWGGFNTAGQLGRGTFFDWDAVKYANYSGLLVSEQPIYPNYGVKIVTDTSGNPISAFQVSAGLYSACAIGLDFNLNCWGSNYFGELGMGNQVPLAANGNPIAPNSYKILSVSVPNCPLPNGMLYAGSTSLPNGASLTAYKYADAPMGQSCLGANTSSITCSSGTLTPAGYTYQFCTMPPAINPASKSMYNGDSAAFTVSDGRAPFTYTATAGVITSSGAYTAPASGTSATVTVTDAVGRSSSAAVTLTSKSCPLPNGMLYAGSTSLPNGASLTAYKYADAPTGQSCLGANTSSITCSSGTLTPAGYTYQFCTMPPAINPTSKSMYNGDSAAFTVSDGRAPFTYTATAGVITSSGAYTAPASGASATVTVTDAVGRSSSATVTLTSKSCPLPNGMLYAGSTSLPNGASLTAYKYADAPMGQSCLGANTSSITCSSGTLTPAGYTYQFCTMPPAINPASKSMYNGDSAAFTVSDGRAPFTYTATAGVITSSGAYTAPASGTSATVTVTDAVGRSSSAAVTLTSKSCPLPNGMLYAGSTSLPNGASLTAYKYADAPMGQSCLGANTSSITCSSGTLTPAGYTYQFCTMPPAINPASKSMYNGDSAAFTVSDGRAPFTYTATAGVITSSGAYTAPASGTSATVTVTDAVGRSSSAAVTLTSKNCPLPNGMLYAGSTSLPNGASLTAYKYADAPMGQSCLGANTSSITCSSGTLTPAGYTYQFCTMPPAINPASKSMYNGDSAAFTVSDGRAPFTYTATAGVITSSGAYTAPASGTSATVTVTDAVGRSSSAAVTLTSKNCPLPNGMLYAGSTSLPNGASLTAYKYADAPTGQSCLGANTSSITCSSGTLTPAGYTYQFCTMPPSLSPASLTVGTGSSGVISVSNGRAPFNFALVSGLGSISASSTSFTFASTLKIGTSTVRVTDAVGRTSDAAIVVVDQTAPTISISGSKRGSTVNLSATASDNVGVQKVEFYVIGSSAPKCVDTTAPYTCSFSSAKSLSVQGVAYDAAGKSTSSNSLNLK